MSCNLITFYRRVSYSQSGNNDRIHNAVCSCIFENIDQIIMLIPNYVEMTVFHPDGRRIFWTSVLLSMGNTGLFANKCHNNFTYD